MEQEFNILNQIKKEQKNVNIFSVPNNYFNDLANKILIKLSTNTTPYQVQNNYFNNLSNNIFDKIKKQEVVNDIEAELNEVAPLLNTIKKQNLYAVPANYFNNVNFKKPKAKVISLWNNTFIKYVSAACLVIASSIMLLINSNKKVDENIAKIHEQSIKTNIENEVSKLEEVDLIKTIHTQKSATTTTNTKNEIAFVIDIHEQVKTIEDAELEHYLQTNKAEEELHSES